MVFSFYWDDCNTQDKLETKVMLNVRLGGGEGRAAQTGCIMRNSQGVDKLTRPLFGLCPYLKKR